MAESLKEVIERLKQQHSQPSKKVEEKAQEIPEPVEDEEEIDATELQETPKVQEKPVEVKVNQENTKNTPSKEDIQQQQQLMEIELLQNDGRFRAELLFQLQEMNKAIIVIAGILADMVSKNGS